MPRPEMSSLVRYRPSATVCAVLLCVALIAARTLRGSAFPPPVSRAGEYVVARVEGDGTLVLANGQPVRLLGVRFPESDSRIDPDALGYLRDMAAGRRVTLELDRARMDRQYRSLAYVHVDGSLLNAEVVRLGHGRLDRGAPLQSERLGQIEDAEDAARTAGVGVWFKR